MKPASQPHAAKLISNVAQNSGQDLLVVLFGGESPEHEVSCKSAFNIVSNTDPERFKVELLAITQSGDWVRPSRDFAPDSSGPPTSRLYAQGESVNVWDELGRIQAQNGVVFPALHGPGGEDGTVQGLLELADVAYIGVGIKTSAVCIDKIATKQVLLGAGLPVVPYRAMAANQSDALPDIAEQLGYPIFVKPSNMGSSIGVGTAKNSQELEEAVALASGYSNSVVLEPAVVGREIECALLGNHQDELKSSLPCEVIPGSEFYTYEDKYLNDRAQLLAPAPLSQQDQAAFMKLAIEVGRAVGVEGLSRVDFLWDEKQGPFINEINTMPGFTSLSLYPQVWEIYGVSFPKLVERLYELGRQAHGSRAELRKSWRTDAA